MDCFPLLVRLSVWPICGLHRTPWALWALAHSGPSHLEEQVVFEYPLHGDHQQVLQLELPILDLQGAFLGVGGAASGFRASLLRDARPQLPHLPAWGGGQIQALNDSLGVQCISGQAPRHPPHTHCVQRARGLPPLTASGSAVATWRWIPSDPCPGIYPRCSGEPAHTKGGPPSGMRAPRGCMDTQGHQASLRGVSPPNTAGERGHATRIHPGKHPSSQIQPGKPRLCEPPAAQRRQEPGEELTSGAQGGCDSQGWETPRLPANVHHLGPPQGPNRPGSGISCSPPLSQVWSWGPATAPRGLRLGRGLGR